MDDTIFSRIFYNQLIHKYYSQRELVYGNDPGYNMSPHDYSLYLDYVDKQVGERDLIYDLRLKSFNSKHIFFVACRELISFNESYITLLKESIVENKPLVSNAFQNIIYKSRLYSEIEGTLNVENVPTTRKRLKELLEKNAEPKDLNDIIIKNMDEGVKFVCSMPDFNKDNLLKLYKILSNGCLDEKDQIKDGNYYRDDEVEIDDYSGCPCNMVGECMDSLFSFVKTIMEGDNSLDKLYLPHICHYYIVYVHPYFDYNGRTARMVSFWINLLANNNIMPPLISEAINQNKNDYYKALRNTRNSRNDITYFLMYALTTTINYILCYKDLEQINQMVKNQGDVLTDTELNYVKKILISYKGKFSYQDFIKNCQIDISKQGAFKILNRLVELNVLSVAETPSRVKLFDINMKSVKYTKMKNTKTDLYHSVFAKEN